MKPNEEARRRVRRWTVPAWPIILLLVAVPVLFIQGLRMAADRQRMLEPARAMHLEIETSDEKAAISADVRFLSVDLGSRRSARIGLYQFYPERSLVRWIEPEVFPAHGTLILPLQGLQEGEYALAAVDSLATAGPREMDLPVESLDILLRFTR